MDFLENLSFGKEPRRNSLVPRKSPGNEVEEEMRKKSLVLGLILLSKVLVVFQPTTDSDNKITITVAHLRIQFPLPKSSLGFHKKSGAISWQLSRPK